MFFSHALRKSLIANFYCSHTPGQGMNAASFWLASNGCFTGSPTLTQRSRNKKFPSLRQCVPVWAWSTFLSMPVSKKLDGTSEARNHEDPRAPVGFTSWPDFAVSSFSVSFGFWFIEIFKQNPKDVLVFFLHFTVMFTCLDSFVLSNYINSI